MPVENERKYLLPLDLDPSRLGGWTKHDIRQAYLDDGPRVRQIDADHFFTYKKWIPHARELVEIELAISKDDFELLWSIRVETLEKTRYAKRIGAAEWIVDFLHDPAGNTFVVLAEVEMPRHVASPESIPSEIASHILHAVAVDDSRFTNRKLSDPAHAARMYELVNATPLAAGD
jgi:CYTH domain-containing protein